MRNILLFVLAALLLASCKPAPRDAASPGFLKTEGRHIVNGQGEFVLLAGYRAGRLDAAGAVHAQAVGRGSRTV